MSSKQASQPRSPNPPVEAPRGPRNYQAQQTGAGRSSRPIPVVDMSERTRELERQRKRQKVDDVFGAVANDGGCNIKRPQKEDESSPTTELKPCSEESLSLYPTRNQALMVHQQPYGSYQGFDDFQNFNFNQYVAFECGMVMGFNFGQQLLRANEMIAFNNGERVPQECQGNEMGYGTMQTFLENSQMDYQGNQFVPRDGRNFNHRGGGAVLSNVARTPPAIHGCI